MVKVAKVQAKGDDEENAAAPEEKKAAKQKPKKEEMKATQKTTIEKQASQKVTPPSAVEEVPKKASHMQFLKDALGGSESIQSTPHQSTTEPKLVAAYSETQPNAAQEKRVRTGSFFSMYSAPGNEHTKHLQRIDGAIGQQ